MANVEYNWPKDPKVIGKRTSRLDGMAKSTGAAKYTYDVNLKDQLIVKALGCPHAHCRIKSIDISEAEKVPGVELVHILSEPTKNDEGEKVLPEIRTQGTLLVAVAAESEAAASEGVSKVKVDYELLEVFVAESDLEAAIKAQRTKLAGGQVELEEKFGEPGDDEDEEEFEKRVIEKLLKESKYVVEAEYGIDSITHCCMEPHGATLEWKDNNKLDVHLSTQNVSGTDDGFASALNIAADDVDVHCEYIGGGFGSKFKPDSWGAAAAVMAKKIGRPIKFLLSRDQELKIGGNRPSGYIKVRLGADEDGIVQVWDSHHWGTSGFDGRTVNVAAIPYVFRPKNNRRKATGIITDNEPSVAWRAPSHPQACAITQTAYDDLAAKMGVDSYDIFMKNLQNIASRQKAEVYAEELKIAARLMDWNGKWHPHGKGIGEGSVVDGLGIGIHEWGGNANNSACQLKVYPDGGVESFCGTQDLGTGTRTVCAMVLAETFGIPVESVKVNIGHSTYPNSGASGGSTTVGAVSESHRRAAQDTLGKIFDLVAKQLDVEPDSLVVADGKISVESQPNKNVSWKQACSLIGISPLEVTSRYQSGSASPLSGNGVGGVQMAHVSVDKETGQVKLNKFVAVQDIGLVVNHKLAESQIYGAVIMAIAYSLFEQRINDPKSGAFLNAELSDYRLPRIGDIGEIVIDIYEPESEKARGVIGLGEPPVISGGAAISNAVCNALGVRVPVLPITPKRVLDSLNKARA